MVLQSVVSLTTHTPLKLHFCAAIKTHSFLHLRSSRAATMAETKIRPAKPKRPTCPTCSKPASICLCALLNTKQLDNSIAVTVLQHSLEKKHPLNSVRIASLGLKNVVVSTVSDVNFDAGFRIRLFESEVESEINFPLVAHKVFEKCSERKTVGNHINGKRKLESVESFEAGDSDKQTVVSINITKQGVITSLSHNWRVENSDPTLNFEAVLKNPSAREALSRGFVVQKLQKQGQEEHVEFNIKIPVGSILLFPSEDALEIEELRSNGFEVKNVIVLDGTWAKAKRMYNENPWLKLVPHVRLKTGTVSLYDGVRMQPKAGFLSTIESVVFALRTFGSDDPEGLEALLGVFEAMVGHQRRCREEGLRDSSA